MTTAPQTRFHLNNIVSVISQRGNPDKPFFYLGGPMTGIPQFNFPRFYEVGEKLREQGYNLVSPAELDDAAVAAAALNSSDGSMREGIEGLSHSDLLGRDLIICALPNCVGMICLEGWEKSYGAAAESWVVSYLGKQLYTYTEGPEGNPILIAIERDDELRRLLGNGSMAGTLPDGRDFA